MGQSRSRHTIVNMLQLSLYSLLLLSCTALASTQRSPRQLGNGNPYNFGYQVQDSDEGLNYLAKQSSDGTVVQGEYMVRLPGGRKNKALKRHTFSHLVDERVKHYSVVYRL